MQTHLALVSLCIAASQVASFSTFQSHPTLRTFFARNFVENSRKLIFFEFFRTKIDDFSVEFLIFGRFLNFSWNFVQENTGTQLWLKFRPIRLWKRPLVEIDIIAHSPSKTLLTEKSTLQVRSGRKVPACAFLPKTGIIDFDEEKRSLSR